MSKEIRPEVTIEELLKRHASGDKKAYNELISRTSERMSRLARKLLPHNPALERWETPEDISQWAIIRFLSAMEDVPLTSEEGLMGLASLQVRRVIVDRYRYHFCPRRQKGRYYSNSLPLLNESGETALIYELMVDPEGSPAEKSDENELKTLVNSLEQEHRTVFMMVYALELKHSDVAQKLGISTATVKRRWKEAKDALKQLTCDWEPRRRKKWWQFWRQ